MSRNETVRGRDSEALTEAEMDGIRQNSEYSDEGKAAPDNNIFFEHLNNPLSSKGN